MNSKRRRFDSGAGAMRHSRCQKKLLAVLGTIALLAIESIALAHEIEHDLGHHDEPACALHLYIGNAGNPVADGIGLACAIVPVRFDVPPHSGARYSTLVLGYHGRAPPHAGAQFS
jgi:hypothetical protein